MNTFLVKSIVFIILFIFVTNYFQIKSFLKLIVGPKIKTEPLNDKWINSTVLKKTGLKLSGITLFKDKLLYGMMTGFGPSIMPQMILSEGLYKTLNRDELEWVILHEAGHCILYHNLEGVIIEAITLVVGLYSMFITNMNFILVPIFALFFSFVCIQVIRWLIEYQADKFSINRVENPKGVITAQAKFIRCYEKGIIKNNRGILRFLLYWNIYPQKRIEMAKLRLSLT